MELRSPSGNGRAGSPRSSFAMQPGFTRAAGTKLSRIFRDATASPSMLAGMATAASLRRLNAGETLAALLLLDPVIRKRNEYTGPWTQAQYVAKRRNRWASPQEMFERFEKRQPFQAWDRNVVRGY